MMRELCPECGGESSIVNIQYGYREICPLCHGRRWISPWRKTSEELPPVDDIILVIDAARSFMLAEFIVEISDRDGKPVHFWWNINDDAEIERPKYWQPIEQPEEEK